MYYLLNESFRYLKYQYISATILCNDFYPVTINHEALEILKLCDGTKSFEDITNLISNIYNEDIKVVKKYVQEFLESSIEKGIVQKCNEPQKYPVKISVSGSKEYWSPTHIAVEMTYRCPLYCKHCFAKAGDDGITMDAELLNSLIEEMIKLNVKSVQLTGGEPLLHPEFPRILKKLLKNNITVNVTTSGYINNARICEELKALSKTRGYIQVSLDGFKEYHNEFRGKDDAYEKTIDFIKKMISYNVEVKVALCYSNQGYVQIEELCKYMKDIGVSAMRFGIVEQKGRAVENFEQINKHIQIEYYQFVNKLKEKYANDQFSIDIDDEHNISAATQYLNCGCGYNTFKINPLGFVAECVLSNDYMGQISSTYGLIDFLKENNKKIYSNVTRKAPCKELCSDCENLYECNGCMIKGRNKGCKNSKMFE